MLALCRANCRHGWSSAARALFQSGYWLVGRRRAPANCMGNAGGARVHQWGASSFEMRTFFFLDIFFALDVGRGFCVSWRRFSRGVMLAGTVLT